jgi:hypothetical protein
VRLLFQFVVLTVFSLMLRGPSADPWRLAWVAIGGVPHESESPGQERAEQRSASQDQVRAGPVRIVAGTVVDEKGAPIGGADVWLPLISSPRAEDRRTAHEKTDDEGRFRLEVPESWIRKPSYENNWAVWAYAPGHSLGTGSAWMVRFSPQAAGDIEIKLAAESDTTIVVFGADSTPLAGANVAPFHFKASSIDIVPPEILPYVSGRTDSAGRARLPAIPHDRLWRVEVTATGYGRQTGELRRRPDGPAERTVHLRLIGRIEGRVIADDPKAVRGVRIWLTTEEADAREGNFQSALSRLRAEAPKGTDIKVTLPDPATEGFAWLMSDDDGRFVVPEIATGSLRIIENLDYSLPVRARIPQKVRVEPGQVMTLEIPLLPAVSVSGVVRIRKSGKPVEGAEVYVCYGRRQNGESAFSDEQGRFHARVLPGDVRLQVLSKPQEYSQLNEGLPDRIQVPEGVDRFDLPPIELAISETIQGHVVDGSDRPLARVQVMATVGGVGRSSGETAQDGSFKLERIPEGTKIQAFKVLVNGAFLDATIVQADPLVLRVSTGR